ncbi:MAG: hypothetical protein ACFFE6_04330 [Candidatus Thorarchaeota archaeon]
MERIRPELLKGLGILSLFILLTITTSLFIPYPISTSEYTFVDLDRVKEDPSTFNGVNISSTAIVESTFYLKPTTFVLTLEDVSLQIRHGLDDWPDIEMGDWLYVRGTYRNGSVQVHEYYVLDYSSSIIRSIPGIILFVVMFFRIFTIDFRSFAFVSRRHNDA